jgi:hypothetical protein
MFKESFINYFFIHRCVGNYNTTARDLRKTIQIAAIGIETVAFTPHEYEICIASLHNNYFNKK